MIINFYKIKDMPIFAVAAAAINYAEQRRAERAAVEYLLTQSAQQSLRDMPHGGKL